MSKCKVIAVANQKGGVGKTTTTANIAIGLARNRQEVLVVDFDPQGELPAKKADGHAPSAPKDPKKQDQSREGGSMAKFIYTGQEYLNADHITSIDTVPSETTIWIRLDTGEKYARSKKDLEEILDILGYYDSQKVEIHI